MPTTNLDRCVAVILYAAVAAFIIGILIVMFWPQ